MQILKSKSNRESFFSGYALGRLRVLRKLKRAREYCEALRQENAAKTHLLSLYRDQHLTRLMEDAAITRNHSVTLH
jgi:hypothetical protein